MLLADLADSAAAFRAEALAFPSHARDLPVRVLDYPPFPAGQVLTRRLAEVVLHHTDLGAGYGLSKWPLVYASMDLPEPMRSQREDRRNPGRPS